ncbi:DUF998 domain-containing protein [Spirillospora sp. CA-255316]
MASRKPLWPGIAGPSLFTLVWLVEGAIRPGYDPMRNWISELALTSRGWIQITGFLVSGLLIAVYGIALRDALSDGPGALWGPRLVTVTGTALALAGAFVIDPGTYRPPGTPAGPTWHGVLHDIFGAVVFVAAAVTVVVLSKRLTPWIGWVTATAMLTLWAASGVAEGIDHAPAGLLQRLSILTGFGYLAWTALRIPSAARGPGPPET